MLQQPKRTKYRKIRKGRIKGIASKKVKVAFGTYGLKSLEAGRITARQIEACRKVIMRRVKNIGKLWIRVFPDIPVTQKPTEVRMGKGKGNVSFWVAKIRPGTIMFEIDGVSEELAKNIFRKTAHKLPVLTRIVEK